MTDHSYREPDQAQAATDSEDYRPRIGSLCSGYGGLDLALEAFTGGSTAWHVEYDKHPSAILAHHFPGVPNYGDVKHTDWNAVEPVEWLTAGYPCQPFSGAGLRLGDTDERHLWPAVAVAVRHLRPRGVLLENVAGHLSLGFGQVLGDLAALGYDARWLCLRAADAGAPHGRSRVFIAATDAHADHHGRGSAGTSGPRGVAGVEAGAVVPWDTDRPGATRDGGQDAAADASGRRPAEQLRDRRVTDLSVAREHGGHSTPANANVAGPQGGEPARRFDMPAWGAYEPAIRRWERVLGRSAPAATEPGKAGRPRLSAPFVEWLMGLPVGWVTGTSIPRSAQLKALGNGVVPQQALLALGLLVPTASAVAA